MSDLDRLLAALAEAAGAEPPDAAADALAALAAPAPRRPPGRPPALTPEQVRLLRRLRLQPRTRRPHIDTLARDFGVAQSTVRQALRAQPPYDFGEPVPRKGGRHRTRRRPAEGSEPGHLSE